MRGVRLMSFYWRLRYMLRKTKEIRELERELEEAKGVKGSKSGKGVKGIRDTLREIDENILKDDGSD